MIMIVQLIHILNEIKLRKFYNKFNKYIANI